MSDDQGQRIPDPIANDLRPALSPERVDRLWRSINEARAAGGRGSARSRGLRSPAFALAAATCFVLAGVALVRLAAPSFAPGSEAPLLRADGAAIEAITPVAHAVTVPLSDGSELWVAPGSALTPLDVSERSVVLHLVRGRSRFAVKPGGPRRWMVEAGHASVEVVGTRFSVERDADGVTVQVEEGKVLVRGGTLPDGVVRLAAGESVRVPARATLAGARKAEPPEPPVEITDETSKLEPAPPAQRASPAPSPQPTRTPAPPVKKPSAPDAAALFAIADDARIARDYRGAIEALERVIREHGGDPRAKLAAFTIGRIRDEQFRDLAGATLAYENALALGLAGSLAEDCYSRLLRVLEVQVVSGRESRARLVQTAQQYLQRYPKGKYAAEARKHLAGERAR